MISVGSLEYGAEVGWEEKNRRDTGMGSHGSKGTDSLLGRDRFMQGFEVGVGVEGSG